MAKKPHGAIGLTAGGNIMKKIILYLTLEIVATLGLGFQATADTGAAKVTLNEGRAFLAVASPNPVHLTLDIVPNGWLGQQAEVFVWGMQSNGGNVKQVYLAGNAWQAFKDLDAIAPLQTMTVDHVNQLDWPLLADTSQLPYDLLEFQYCLDNTVDGSLTWATLSCAPISIKFDKISTVSPGIRQGELLAASVKNAQGLVLGSAQALTKTTAANSISFSIPVTSPYGILVIYGDDDTGNKKLNGVEVSLKDAYQTLATIKDGKTLANGFTPLQLQAFPSSTKFKAINTKILEELAVSNFTSSQAILDRLMPLEQAIKDVSPKTWRKLYNFQQQVKQTALFNFNLPLTSRPKKTAAPLFAVLNPPLEKYKLQVSVAAGTKPFAVEASYIPLSASSANRYGDPMENDDFFYRSHLKAEAHLNNALAGIAPPLAVKQNALGEIPGACQDLMDSRSIKLVTSVITAAGTGALGKVVGGILNLGGEASENIGSAIGLFGDADDWVDLTKTSIRYLIAERLPLLDEIRVAPKKRKICLGETTAINIGYFNRCDGMLFGAGLGPVSENIRVNPALVGDLNYQGFSWGAGVWGTGDKYLFRGATVGVADIVVTESTFDGPVTGHTQITVERCASSKVTPGQ